MHAGWPPAQTQRPPLAAGDKHRPGQTPLRSSFWNKYGVSQNCGMVLQLKFRSASQTYDRNGSSRLLQE
eukprot:1136790-Pelagomonas_calceolata.AAC.2